MQYVHTMEHYSVVKKNNMKFVSKHMEQEKKNILSEVTQARRTMPHVLSHLTISFSLCTLFETQVEARKVEKSLGGRGDTVRKGGRVEQR